MSQNHDDRTQAGIGSDPRDWNRGIMLDSMPAIAAAKSLDALWSVLWDTIRKMLPQTAVMQIFRGEEAAVKETWTSLRRAPSMSLILRGWGSNFERMMQERSTAKAFLKIFGETEEAAQARLDRFFTDLGNPLLLNDPDQQLSVFLSEEDVQKVRDARPHGQAPGQVMLCPILVEGRLDLVASLSALPGQQPYTWDDAADVWQLTKFAHEVSMRIRAEKTVMRHLDEVRMLRATMRRISVATDVAGLAEEVGTVAQRLLKAPRAFIVAHDQEGHGGARVLWRSRIEERDAQKAGTEIMRAFATEEGPRRLTIIESVGGSEGPGGFGLQFAHAEALSAVPLEVHGRLFGTLVLFWPRPRRIAPDERGSLEFLGGELSLAMDHRRLSGELTDSEAELRSIINAVNEGVMSLDQRGRLRYCNARAAELLGISVPASEGTPLLDLLPERRRQGVSPLLSLVLSGQPVVDQLLAGQDQRVTVTVFQGNTAGEMSRSLWIFRNDETPAAQGGLVEAMLQHVSEPFLVLDRTGRVLEANGPARQYLGTELFPEEIVDESPSYRWGGEFDEAFLDQLDRYGFCERTGLVEERAGRLISYEATFWRVGQGDDCRILAAIRDHTLEEQQARFAKGRREAYQLTKQIEALIDELESGLSTQRDLVTSVLTQCELAREEKTDGARLLTTIETVQTSAGRGSAGLARCGDVIKDLAGILKQQSLSMEVASSGSMRQVWIISDRPQRRERLLQLMSAEGLEATTVEVEEVTVATEYTGLPDLVVVDLVSLNGIEEVYNRVRRIAPGLPLVVISAVGALTGSTTIAEDPRLHVMKDFPSGSELTALLATILPG